MESDRLASQAQREDHSRFIIRLIERVLVGRGERIGAVALRGLAADGAAAAGELLAAGVTGDRLLLAPSLANGLGEELAEPIAVHSCGCGADWGSRRELGTGAGWLDWRSLDLYVDAGAG